ncbi:protein disulfide-isomerase A5-like [Oscarella lobularis]|uniref:protein disulfide-isomerase A5-like n=1 Tax=Oscarella lobularis TaxID=121494 RepID=UPI0033141209
MKNMCIDDVSIKELLLGRGFVEELVRFLVGLEGNGLREVILTMLICLVEENDSYECLKSRIHVVCYGNALTSRLSTLSRVPRSFFAMERGLFLLVFATFLCLLGEIHSKSGKADLKNVVSDVDDIKEFKKLLRTRKNVLILFGKSTKSVSAILPVFGETATAMKGLAALVTIDCTSSSKLCKKLKIPPGGTILKHYKDGEFNKDYDRKFTVRSMRNFLDDPTGEEEAGADDVFHLDSDKEYRRMLKKEKKPILLMLYAPWCGVCKMMKPAYAEAATELKDKAILAGVDATKQENRPVAIEFNITGYPTIVYFEKGIYQYNYGGGRSKDEIVQWMADPKRPSESDKPAEEEAWSDTSENIHHLTELGFQDALSDHKSLLVMFYAPWCGHCKKMKPEYENAAATLKEEGIEDAVLAAVDATKEPELGKAFEVKGYPTVKYFKYVGSQGYLTIVTLSLTTSHFWSCSMHHVRLICRNIGLYCDVT